MSQNLERVADVSEVPAGTMKIVKLIGEDVVIANVSGEYFAFSNRCTHVGGPLGKGKLNGAIVQCPWHGSKFDVKTGAVAGPPARNPVRSFVVRIQSNNIMIEKLP